MPFQAGNTLGSKSRLWERHLLALIEAEFASLPSERQRIVQAANKVLDLAAGGERWACEMLRDTLDGRPKQALDIGTDDPARALVVRVSYGREPGSEVIAGAVVAD